MLYAVNSDSWDEIKEILAQLDDDFLKLIDALPDYDGVDIDEDVYQHEQHILLGDTD